LRCNSISEYPFFLTLVGKFAGRGNYSSVGGEGRLTIEFFFKGIKAGLIDALADVHGVRCRYSVWLKLTVPFDLR